MDRTVQRALEDLEHAKRSGDACDTFRATKHVDAAIKTATSKYRLDGEDLLSAIKQKNNFSGSRPFLKDDVGNIATPPSPLDDFDAYGI